LVEILKKTTANLIRDSQSPGVNMNKGLPEDKARLVRFNLLRIGSRGRSQIYHGRVQWPDFVNITRSPRFSKSEGLTVLSMRIQSEIYVLLGYFAVYSGNSLPTFRENLSVPSSRVKNLA